MTGCFSELNQHILPLISGYIFCRVFLVLAQGLYFWSEVTRKLTTQLKSAFKTDYHKIQYATRTGQNNEDGQL